MYQRTLKAVSEKVFAVKEWDFYTELCNTILVLNDLSTKSIA